MVISKRINHLLNEQWRKEVESAYIYFAMALEADQHTYPGLSHWLHIQSKEELSHADLFRKFIEDRAGILELYDISKPEFNWTSAKDAIEKAYNHEMFVTESISNILDLAIEEKDHMTVSFLQHLIDEQVEEETSTRNLLDMYKLADNNLAALMALDKSLLKRN